MIKNIYQDSKQESQNKITKWKYEIYDLGDTYISKYIFMLILKPL